MKDSKVEKLFLIYSYEKCGGSNVKLFDAITHGDKIGDWDFTEHTPEENEKYLLEWKKENNIALTSYKISKPTDKNIYDKYGTPVFIRKVGKNEVQKNNNLC